MRNKLKEKYNQIKLGSKHLYLVVNLNDFDTEDNFLDAVASSFEGGVGILQLSDTSKNAKKILSVAKKLKQLCLQYDVTFIVKSRIDIAALAEADGVYLAQEDLDVDSAREILGENAIVGVATHSAEQAVNAINDGADYIMLGPIFEDRTNAEIIPLGLECLNWISDNVNIPVFAAGGIDLDNIHLILDSGIDRISLGCEVLKAKSPQKMAESFCKSLKLN